MEYWELEVQRAPACQKDGTNGRGAAGPRARQERGRARGDERETISDGRAYAGVKGFIQGGDGDTNGNWVRGFDLGYITSAKVGTGEWSLRYAGYHRGMSTLASSRRQRSWVLFLEVV